MDGGAAADGGSAADGGGNPDAGVTSDAGTPDAGSGSDAGTAGDAGAAADAGGIADAGENDAGENQDAGATGDGGSDGGMTADGGPCDGTDGGVIAQHSISGTLSGAAGTAISVSLSGAGSATTTADASGAYVFAGLADGAYVVTPSAAGYAFTPASISISVAGADSPGNNFNAAGAPSSAGATFVRDPAPGVPDAEGNASPAIAIDASGRVHLAFLSTALSPNQLIYATCAGACQQGASWSSVAVEAAGSAPLGTSIALDASGHPRIHYIRDNGLSHSFRYLECDLASCTDSSAWTGVDAASSSNANNGDGVQSLALDAQGHPAFLHAEPYSNDLQLSLYLTRCTAADCTVASAWTDSAVPFPGQQKDNGFTYLLGWQRDLRLAIDASGSLHVFGRAFDQVLGSSALRYLSCSANCDQTASWAGVQFAGPQNGANALRFDSAGNPRFVFSDGASFTYGSCDQDCASAANWTQTALDTSAEEPSPGVDLAIDSQGGVRVAYALSDASNDNTGVGLASCDSNCDSAGAWSFRTVEPSTALPPITPASGCGAGQWWSGMNTQLALLPGGEPVLAFDATHQAGGTCSGTDRQLVRVALP